MLSEDEKLLIKMCKTVYVNLSAFNDLLSRKVNVDVKDALEKTPLHHSIHIGHIEYIQRLLQLGANPNSRDKEGNTPLHVAVRKQSIRAIPFLIMAGASFKFRNIEGITPLDLINSSNNNRFIDWIGDYRQKIKVEKQQALLKLQLYEHSNALLQQTVDQQRLLIQQLYGIIEQQHQQIMSIPPYNNPIVLQQQQNNSAYYPVLPKLPAFPYNFYRSETPASYFFQLPNQTQATDSIHFIEQYKPS